MLRSTITLACLLLFSALNLVPTQAKARSSSSLDLCIRDHYDGLYARDAHAEAEADALARAYAYADAFANAELDLHPDHPLARRDGAMSWGSFKAKCRSAADLVWSADRRDRLDTSDDT